MVESAPQGVRIAVEGCGHGTLHSIYASIDEACRVKGWDEGVDLVIIGGDFQAVRNRHDLNVTAMPQHYRKMADFHEYYSGTVIAPYPTIFIGGNHEASNHLFELYYGGWVAPNIYYLGAANIIRFGPLRIAGLSGIWKSFDYRKPHFERLPYNNDDMRSIFHVREVDVRKILAVGSQVDIGLSHDWPQGVELLGEHKWLFRKKPDFARDSEAGKLGSVAARQCLERLRPVYWFSAHLHTKYPAIVEHGIYEPVRHPKNPTIALPMSKAVEVPNSSNSGNRNITAGPSSLQPDIYKSTRAPETAEEDRALVTGWNNWAEEVQQDEAAKKDAYIEDERKRKQEQERTGKRDQSAYTTELTFKPVSTGDGTVRERIRPEQERKRPVFEPEPVQSIPNTDGCGSSRPTSLKRRRDVSSLDGSTSEHPSEDESLARDGPAAAANLDNLNGGTESTSVTNLTQNPDEIDIDMSDEDSEDARSVTNAQNTAVPGLPATEVSNNQPAAMQGMLGASTGTDSVQKRSATVADEDSVDTAEDINSLTQHAIAGEIPNDVIAQLAELSSDFAPVQKVEVSRPLSLPAAIRNTKTHFLALGKCERFQEFLQLMEVDAISEQDASNDQQTFKLSYDPEWLAILRVFAPELKLGGEPTDQVAPHRGDTYYRDRIAEEAQWIHEHVVQPGKLEVPPNFTITAPIYDPDQQVDMREMPREVSNPQTSAFCKLIGIENLFDITEAERNSRIAAGPRSDRPFDGKGRGRGGGHGGRGGRGQGQGRGRSGGGGRGGWRGRR